MTDFGLARRMQSRGDDFTVLAPEATVVMGTFGYVAPEYARTGEFMLQPLICRTRRRLWACAWCKGD